MYQAVVFEAEDRKAMARGDRRHANCSCGNPLVFMYDVGKKAKQPSATREKRSQVETRPRPSEIAAVNAKLRRSGLKPIPGTNGYRCTKCPARFEDKATAGKNRTAGHMHVRRTHGKLRGSPKNWNKKRKTA